VLRTNQPKISRHLAYLRKAGLVTAREDGKWTHYRLKTPAGKPGKILADILTALRKEPQIKADLRRLKKIGC
jgi:ArsR family transcriptional regulator, arsenate/arsenite/antimonite-responsive transcriptional repressor